MRTRTIAFCFRTYYVCTNKNHRLELLTKNPLKYMCNAASGHVDEENEVGVESKDGGRGKIEVVYETTVFGIVTQPVVVR